MFQQSQVGLDDPGALFQPQWFCLCMSFWIWIPGWESPDGTETFSALVLVSFSKSKTSSWGEFSFLVLRWVCPGKFELELEHKWRWEWRTLCSIGAGEWGGKSLVFFSFSSIIHKCLWSFEHYSFSCHLSLPWLWVGTKVLCIGEEKVWTPRSSFPVSEGTTGKLGRDNSSGTAVTGQGERVQTERGEV